MADADPTPQSETPEPEPAEDSEPAPPLNRAERRAQQRGKQLSQPSSDGYGPQQRRRDQVVVPRRSGRRGNR